MLGHRNEIARLQSVFYRDQFHKMIRWIMASLGIVFILIAVIVYLILFQPSPQYYADTTDGKIMMMQQQKTIQG